MLMLLMLRDISRETQHPTGGHAHTLMHGHRHVHTDKHSRCWPHSSRNVLCIILPTPCCHLQIRRRTSNSQPLRSDRRALPLNPPTFCDEKSLNFARNQSVVYYCLCHYDYKLMATWTFLPSSLDTNAHFLSHTNTNTQT